jgi:hypothetical protein
MSEACMSSAGVPGPLPLGGAAHKAAGATNAARQNPKNLPVTLIRVRIVVNADAGCNTGPPG